ncbi:MAG: hypothetical protein EXX96DRAFT_616860 [Benjaminiella poitrasii]|nr:MAG: hypothetical protein EXX96DRAFT_616860 [Benjaminiella poitrasii]
MPKTHTTHTLIRNNLILDLMENVPFDDGDYSKQLQCVLQVYNESMKAADQFTKPTSISNSYISPLFKVVLFKAEFSFHDSLRQNEKPAPKQRLLYVSKLISSFQLSGLLDATEFAPPSTQLLDAINIDFKICPALLHAVAVLHTGCLIVNRSNTLLTLTAEVYSRAKSLDVHGESNMKSIPLPDSQYNGRSVGIHEESDGHPTKMKLKLAYTTICYDKTKQDNFLAIFEEQITERQLTCKCPLSVSSLRQLTSSFKHPSTYATWRATLDGPDNDFLQPATIFNIADVPNIQGYGISDASMAKKASLVLQTIAIALMTERPLENKDIEKIIGSREDAVPRALLAQLQSPHDLDPIGIAPFLLLIVKSAATVLSTANQKIKTNVEAKLQTLFGNQN